MSDFKKIKHHQSPGDIPKHDKIRMRESKLPFFIFAWQLMGEKAIRAFRNSLRIRERAVLKERTRKEINRQLLDNQK